MVFKPLHFIGQQVQVEFDEEPILSKKPGCPDRFLWEGQSFQVKTLLSQWQDFGRRGRMARNMRPENTAKALRRGSWGVGRFYFRVATAGGRIFDLYYDRAPKDAADRLGAWFLDREMIEEQD
ncbi:MAG: DUF6504 family protein [Anaerolineales bacterium]